MNHQLNTGKIKVPDTSLTAVYRDNDTSKFIKMKENKNIDDLIDEIEKAEAAEEGKNNKIYLYHYTSFESLILILKNRSLRMSRIDLLNDKAEKELSKCKDGELRYVTCFTKEKNEQVAMWTMYGRHSSLKLRIGFNQRALIDSVNNNFFYDSKKKNRIPPDNIFHNNNYTKKEFSLSSMLYYILLVRAVMSR